MAQDKSQERDPLDVLVRDELTREIERLAQAPVADVQALKRALFDNVVPMIAEALGLLTARSGETAMILTDHSGLIEDIDRDLQALTAETSFSPDDAKAVTTIAVALKELNTQLLSGNSPDTSRPEVRELLQQQIKLADQVLEMVSEAVEGEAGDGDDEEDESDDEEDSEAEAELPS